MWRTTYLHGRAVLRRICRLGRAPQNMTLTGRKWTTRLPAIRARTRLSQEPILESLVCPNKRPLNDPGLPVIALLHKPSLTTVFNYSCGLAQCDWGPGPSLTCGQVRCHRNLQVLDAGQVLYDILAVGIPRIDAISEMGAIVYRHFCLPQSSSSSRLTAGASEFFILSQSGERPER